MKNILFLAITIFLLLFLFGCSDVKTPSPSLKSVSPSLPISSPTPTPSQTPASPSPSLPPAVISTGKSDDTTDALSLRTNILKEAWTQEHGTEPDNIVWITYDFAILSSESGSESIIQYFEDEFGFDWWITVGEKDSEYGWIPGENGAGIDIDTSEYLSSELMLQNGLIPLSGYSFDSSTISYLGGSISYIEALGDAQNSNILKLLFGYNFDTNGEIIWFLLAYDSGYGWTVPAG